LSYNRRTAKEKTLQQNVKIRGKLEADRFYLFFFFRVDAWKKIYQTTRMWVYRRAAGRAL